MPHSIGEPRPESIWEQFLDTHTLSRAQEEAFWSYITASAARVPPTMEVLLERWDEFQMSIERLEEP